MPIQYKKRIETNDLAGTIQMEDHFTQLVTDVAMAHEFSVFVTELLLNSVKLMVE